MIGTVVDRNRIGDHQDVDLRVVVGRCPDRFSQNDRFVVPFRLVVGVQIGPVDDFEGAEFPLFDFRFLLFRSEELRRMTERVERGEPRLFDLFGFGFGEDDLHRKD